MVMLCSMLWQDFSFTVFSLKHDVLIIKHTSSEMLSFLHRWDYCWKCEFDADVKIENYYQHGGEQLGFYKKYISKYRAGCFCNLYIARNKEFQFIWQRLGSRERQILYSTWRKLT